MWRWLPWVVLLVSGCEEARQGFEGERVGTFAFTAEVVKLPDGTLDPAWQDCTSHQPPIDEIPTESFSFEAILSRDRRSGDLLVTIGEVSRKATFDGQYLESTFTARRHFRACCKDQGQLKETLRVALLSRSQDIALGRACPPDALSGGIPVGDGITPPGDTESGFDALRACGLLIDVVEPGDCGECSGCTLRYPLTGVRR